MKNIYKIILISLAILAIILGILYWLFVKSVGEIDVPSTLNEVTIEFPELNEKAYIRARAWGLAGNHEEIIISTTPIEKDRQAAKGEDYIFYTTEIYYQKRGIDTLMVYADASTIGKIPNGLKTSINIVTVGLKNYDEVKKYERNYKESDLNKISVYNE